AEGLVSRPPGRRKLFLGYTKIGLLGCHSRRAERSRAGAHRVLRAEDAVLAIAPAVGVHDSLHLGLVRWRVEHHDDQKFGALAGDAAGGLAGLPGNVEDAQPIRKTRRHLLGEECRPISLAHLAAFCGLAAEIEVDFKSG